MGWIYRNCLYAFGIVGVIFLVMLDDVNRNPAKFFEVVGWAVVIVALLAVCVKVSDTFWKVIWKMFGR